MLICIKGRRARTPTLHSSKFTLWGVVASLRQSTATRIEEYAMTLFRMLAALAAFSVSGAAFADTDCTDPVAAWQPRELLQQEFEQHGRTAQRIKVDDGCYEVRGVDRVGNKIKAKYYPASLRIRSLEVDFGPAGDASDYLGPAQPRAGRRERTDPTTKRSVP